MFRARTALVAVLVLFVLCGAASAAPIRPGGYQEEEPSRGFLQSIRSFLLPSKPAPAESVPETVGEEANKVTDSAEVKSEAVGEADASSVTSEDIPSSAANAEEHDTQPYVPGAVAESQPVHSETAGSHVEHVAPVVDGDASMQHAAVLAAFEESETHAAVAETGFGAQNSEQSNVAAAPAPPVPEFNSEVHSSQVGSTGYGTNPSEEFRRPSEGTGYSPAAEQLYGKYEAAPVAPAAPAPQAVPVQPPAVEQPVTQEAPPSYYAAREEPRAVSQEAPPSYYAAREEPRARTDEITRDSGRREFRRARSGVAESTRPQFEGAQSAGLSGRESAALENRIAEATKMFHEIVKGATEEFRDSIAQRPVQPSLGRLSQEQLALAQREVNQMQEVVMDLQSMHRNMYDMVTQLDRALQNTNDRISKISTKSVPAY